MNLSLSNSWETKITIPPQIKSWSLVTTTTMILKNESFFIDSSWLSDLYIALWNRPHLKMIYRLLQEGMTMENSLSGTAPHHRPRDKKVFSQGSPWTLEGGHFFPIPVRHGDKFFPFTSRGGNTSPSLSPIRRISRQESRIEAPLPFLTPIPDYSEMTIIYSYL